MGKLILSYDEDYRNNFLILNLSDIIAINKRPVHKTDINVINIHYKDNSRKNGVKEIKLKLDNRRDTYEWMELLNLKFSPKLYEFEFRMKKEKRLRHYEDHWFKILPKKFFFVIHKLEMFFFRKRKMEFFSTLKIQDKLKIKESINKNIQPSKFQNDIILKDKLCLKSLPKNKEQELDIDDCEESKSIDLEDNNNLIEFQEIHNHKKDDLKHVNIEKK